ncbi:hypothetical protein FQA39_LY11642 [Lamprigera yunnana]|nr:hypothetical protein FQA39_LY11642 [Lamprigera yunnana]
MASYKIAASYLEIDELQYELKKRSFTTTCNVKSMCEELRRILALEKLDKTVDYSKCAVVFDVREFVVLDSRLSHLLCRVDNIPMTNVDEKSRRATLVSKILEVSEQNVKLKSRKPLCHNDNVTS